MRHAETRLMTAWSATENRLAWEPIEHSGETVESFEVDDLPEPTEAEYNALMGFKKKRKRTRHNDIEVVLAVLSGVEVETETNTVFGKRVEKEFVTRPFRSIEEHEAIVKQMATRGFAFNRRSEEKISEFSPRELAPAAMAVFGIINERKDKYQLHKRER